jgi:hypothetical protein
MTLKSERSHDDDIGKEYTCRGDDYDLHLSDNKDENDNVIHI